MARSPTRRPPTSSAPMPSPTRSTTAAALRVPRPCRSRSPRPTTLPTATADTYATNEDTPLTVSAPGVLDNDVDVDGDVLASVLVGGPSNGTVTIFNANGTFTYTPDDGFEGTDSFTYYATDGTLDGNVATPRPSRSWTRRRQRPTRLLGRPDYAFKRRHRAHRANVLDNDSDEEGNTLSVSLLLSRPASTATLDLNSDGSFTYTPDPELQRRGFVHLRRQRRLAERPEHGNRDADRERG